MKLFEFQGKQLFKQYEIPIQSGILLYPNSPLEDLKPPMVIKAQVMTGGRGNAGGIKIWDGSEGIGQTIDSMFQSRIKNEEVKAVLALNSVEIKEEHYISITFDKEKSKYALIAGVSGGVDIEEQAHKNMSSMIVVDIDPLLGLQEYQIRLVAKKLNMEDYWSFRNIVVGMYSMFRDYDASLVEINPLAKTPNGLVAIDSKVEIDEKAFFRNREKIEQFAEQIHALAGIDVFSANEDTITYVPLSGDVGLVSDGAGTGLLSLDLIAQYGGGIANFCELGGITNADVVYKALKKASMDKKVKSLLVVLIGGINRMDHMAEGIVRFYQESSTDIPIYIRMCGTLEDVGRKIMQDNNITIYEKLNDAVEQAVKREKE